jgi:hypothetical protein
VSGTIGFDMCSKFLKPVRLFAIKVKPVKLAPIIGFGVGMDHTILLVIRLLAGTGIKPPDGLYTYGTNHVNNTVYLP